MSQRHTAQHNAQTSRGADVPGATAPGGPATSAVLFVCLGNICRSPLAEGVLRAEVARRGLVVDVDSCGTGSWHVGEHPDPRSVAVAAAHGVDISRHRARQLAARDFDRFDWIVAMDGDNLQVARQRGQAAGGEPTKLDRVVPFMRFVEGARGQDVPDPYYGGPEGFEHVYQLIARGVGPLLDAVMERAEGAEASRP